MVSPERFAAPEGRDLLARLRHVFRVYRIGDTGVVALGGVDLDVPRGEFLAVVGPSGAGKSTILNLLGGLDRASAGVVDVDGQDLGLLNDDDLTRFRAERVGFVWQGTARNLVPYLTVRENVRLPGALHAGLASTRRRSADELLKLVDLADR
ncbi:MAG: ATP-binding cassette domain-containing protein, partial [Actinomycetota bacterium]